ncbi:histidine phosphatase family protein [Alteriqipengyuania sp. WL0013]|uniref:SixA phosphatase family protein n=1 Tax=Alteriqipengyuania sp. WL0013 TaxID=3110773 RepID=UPI002BA35C13|nr:histidine phosphatase family protein [Alteriqipengyuania sp. WL0013]MEB3415373.1 histidine phosphatase family protein [Alteriqipengyuania sp. WL0013]
MKTLGLLRHAKSDWDDRALRDFDRGLNDRGRRGAALMGAHIVDEGTAWDLLIASPAERVQRTLESAKLGLEPQFDKRCYLASSATLMEVVRDLAGDADRVLLSGHNPGMQELVFDIVAPDAEDALFDEAARKFPTASFAILECDIDDWADLADDCGKLVHFTRPRDLDPDLGPED